MALDRIEIVDGERRRGHDILAAENEHDRYIEFQPQRRQVIGEHFGPHRLL